MRDVVSQELPGVQPAPWQLPPGPALATQVSPSGQVPVTQNGEAVVPGKFAHGRPGLAAFTQLPVELSHAVQLAQPVGASAQVWPMVRRSVQTDCRQNSVPGQSLSAWQGPPETFFWQVPVLAGSSGSALQNSS
jgi:hypothetical protein